MQIKIKEIVSVPRTENQKPRIRNYHGFTLVELIVVITILVILGTIAFISLSGYSGSARDGDRISTIKNIETGLSVYRVKAGKYPTPENILGTGMVNGVALNYVGDIANGISNILKINKKPTDPLLHTNYVYGISYDNLYHQVGVILENPIASKQIDLVTKVYALDSTDYRARVNGNYGGFIKYSIGSANYVANIPSLLYANTGSVALFSTGTYYIVDKKSNLPFDLGGTITSDQMIKDITGNTSATLTGVDITTLTKETIGNVFTGSLLDSFGGNIDMITKAIFGDGVSTPAGTPQVPPAYDSSVFQFLGFDKDLDRVFAPSSIYTSGWTSNLCDTNTIPVYSVLNPRSFFNTGVVLASNTIYKIPNGTYNLTGSTLLDGHIKLGDCTGIIGESKAGVVFNANFSGGSTSATGAIFLVDGKKNDVIASLTVNGNKAGTYKYREGIRLNGATNNTLDNVFVYGNQNHGVITIGSSYNLLSNINSNNNGSYGVILNSGSSYNKLSGLVVYANYTGLMMQVNSSYNTAQNIESYSNTNGTNGNGVFIHDGSKYNTLSNLRIYDNKDNGLVVYSGSTNNKFSDMTINKYNGLGVFVYMSSNNFFENFETYNGNIGIHVLSGSTGNYFNNFQTYNTTGGGININTSTNNAFNNFLSYNHGHISVEVAVNSSYNYFNNLYTFNNNVIKAGDPLSFRFYSNSNYGYLKDYRAYNNSWYGCIEVGSSNTTRSGVYKIFAIAGSDTTGCGALPTGNDGTVMSCSWHVKPAWMGANLGASCTAGYYTNTYIGTQKTTYTFGSNISSQIQPKKWDTTTSSFVNYGTDGVNYDSTKKVGQW